MNKILFEQFQKTEKFNKIIENYKNGKSQQVQGINEESMAFLVCNLLEAAADKILVITSSESKSRKYEEEIKAFTDNAGRFHPKEFILYNVDALSKDVEYKRSYLLDKILNLKKCAVTASINSIVTRVMPKDRFKDSIIVLKYGNCYDMNELKKNLINLKYERVDAIEGVGQFSIRGGIVDIFSPSESNPVRIEFFDDEIDSIRSVDLKTQRSVKNLKSVRIIPCSDLLFNKDEIDSMLTEIDMDYQSRMDKIKNLSESKEVQKKLRSMYNAYRDKMKEGLSIENSDLLVPFLKDSFVSVLDYFGEDFILIVDEPERVFEELGSLNDSYELKFSELFEKGEIFTKQSCVFISEQELKAKLTETPFVSVNGRDKIFKAEESVSLQFKEAPYYYGKMEDLSKDLNRLKYKGYKIAIVLSSNEGCLKLHNLLNDYECTTTLSKTANVAAESGQVIIMPGKVKKGFEYYDNKILILTENEVFGSLRKKPKKAKKRKGSKIEIFTDLKVGDFVVHEHHGIGQYIGIEKIDVQNIKKDYLCIKYKGEDKLYVPVDQMSLIQKYIGSDSEKPKLNKMGSVEWVKTKERTKAAIENMAAELVKLYAQRKVVKGHAFSSDTEWQKEFEYKFPFQETDDQLRCTKEIKKDMERPVCMDRLLCGDVGFGKTEVAMRAAFKAVMDSKQVAILVPTTILAQQHYANIVDRFRGYPVKVEMLSRFRTPYQQVKVINDLNKGLVDIVVGTHKLLSKDLKFKDLGLLIIDEEQRFGVKHKELIKQLKTNIDVLTLSATPIPRTLHMSMIGVRDMSIISEPPGDRLPIQTYVMEYNDGIIKDSIEKEISRGGQVYYVHNRVIDIDSAASKLQKLVPNARIAVAHGQMSERHLENIMLEFVNKEYDILMCTTIIETGMDIPNANTLIIDNADHLGLSQLYQLRGRIGRSNKVAFAYLTYEKDKMLSEVADKRLKAIKEFTEFGSGFKIAMRDLEIRGCGNILGSEQHGHMLAIGYDLYVKFLDRAVKELQGKSYEDEDIETSVDISVDGYIPSTYIENEEQKIEIYKKIAAASSKDDIYDITEEIIDRFGNTPVQVDNLMKISYIKSLCKKLHVKSIAQAGFIVNIELTSGNDLSQDIIGFLIENYNTKIKFDVSREPVIKYRLDSTEQLKILEELEKFFEILINYKQV
ncbi:MULTISPECIES: transcription-repair coupling factor [unclassified Sedimentibacter]|uniref:transcription-repair coupling factor n=1 Tax=unclassified Sedimentibacter TaxID=2649220 RepID=UPI0027E085E9|nr:transcription-repair coupling factor [Sedimentibacter sp. MB35-C1]WMJ76472.1 transcription-repair coupling factor [Sedimentibacter sp. MB35-C1]